MFLTLNCAWQNGRTVAVTTQAEVLHTALMICLPKLYDFRHSVAAILSVTPVWRKWEYLEIQRERNTLSAKLPWKALHLDGKWAFNLKPQENLANMNVTTFSSLQFDSKHFKHATNAIMGAVWSTPVMWINLTFNMTAWQVLVIYVRIFNCLSLGN